MKTTVLGVRLTDYQREKLKRYGSEADTVRVLVDELIDGKLQMVNGRVVYPEPEESVDLSAFERIAEKRRISVQGLLDMIAEQLR